MGTGVASVESLLERARSGDLEALGQLLEQYRRYLQMLARAQLGQRLRVRLDPSDLVQETLLEAQRDFPQFAGGADGELAGWLRRIMARNLADQRRHHHSQKRDYAREERLEALAAHAPTLLAAPLSTPSAQVARREQAVVLSEALAKLPADYGEVLRLRHLEEQSFEVIAARMGRTSGAVRMLWMRALERLGAMVEKE